MLKRLVAAWSGPLPSREVLPGRMRLILMMGGGIAFAVVLMVLLGLNAVRSHRALGESTTELYHLFRNVTLEAVEVRTDIAAARHLSREAAVSTATSLRDGLEALRQSEAAFRTRTAQIRRHLDHADGVFGPLGPALPQGLFVEIVDTLEMLARTRSAVEARLAAGEAVPADLLIEDYGTQLARLAALFERVGAEVRNRTDNAFTRIMREDQTNTRLLVVYLLVIVALLFGAAIYAFSRGRRTEAVLRTAAQGLSGKTGQAFFTALVDYLVDTLRVDVAFVGKLDPIGQAVRTVAASSADGPMAPFRYDLIGTPCQDVLAGGACVFEEGVDTLYPSDALLADGGYQGYAGVPLVAGDGRALGLLVVLSKQPLRQSRIVRSVLQLFSERAGSEMARQASDEQLARARENLVTAQRISGTGSWDWDIRAGRFYCSEEVCRIFALGPGQWRGGIDGLLARVAGDDRDRVASAHRLAVSDGRGYDLEYLLDATNGGPRAVRETVRVERDERGLPARLVGVVRDLTEQRAREMSIRKLFQAVEQSRNSIVITDRDGTIEYVNRFFEHTSGWSREEAMGNNPKILKSGRTSREKYAELWDTIIAGKMWRGELLNRKKDGQLFWEFVTISPVRGNDGEITHFIAIKEDISERKKQEERLVRQAHFDSLTGLPNRLLAADRMGQAIKSARRNQEKVALLFIDLDDFKRINDTLGHATGDVLLSQAAERIRGCLRDEDTVARYGGDEFLVILGELGNSIEAEPAAVKLLTALEAPFVLEDMSFVVTASIGIAVYPDDAADSQELLRNADAAMYRAKEEGRNQFQFFSQSINDRVRHSLELERGLRDALARDELALVYQPLVDTNTRAVVGAEALLRWQSAELGPVPPAEFIPVAEQTGLIVSLGDWVLETACRAACRWAELGYGDLSVSVNVSPRQFRGRDLAARIGEILELTGLPGTRLQVEVTEGLLLRDHPGTLQALQRIRALGVRLAMDDFGTGYSSLTNIRKFPFDALKIDRSFVAGIDGGEEDRAVVSATVAMARGLGLSVVAEGVETEDQAGFLAGCACGLSQGFLFSKPLSGAAFETFLANGTGCG